MSTRATKHALSWEQLFTTREEGMYASKDALRRVNKDEYINARKGDLLQTSASGAIRALSAERLLSHIRPPLAGMGQFTVSVE